MGGTIIHYLPQKDWIFPSFTAVQIPPPHLIGTSKTLSHQPVQVGGVLPSYPTSLRSPSSAVAQSSSAHPVTKQVKIISREKKQEKFAIARSLKSKKNHAGPIDINRASFEELQTIKGIGPVLAQSILDYRNEVGIFKTPADLDKVKGIGPKKLEKLLPNIVFGMLSSEKLMDSLNFVRDTLGN